MNKIRINAGEWVIVCDGRKALILENIGDAQYPNLHTREICEHTEFAPVSRAAIVPARRFRP